MGLSLMEMAIEPARPEDAGELMTVQRAAFLIEGELNNSFTLPPMTETVDEVRKAIASDTVGWSPGSRVPGKQV
jgi:hypothetical protein